jgi:acyl-CoA thioester hydrolase
MKRLRETSVEMQVPFSHVDMLGVVWHGHYFEYCEQARTQLLRCCDLETGDLIGSKYLFFVIESKCRHAFPLFYADQMRITAWIKDIEHRISIHYEITNLNHGRRAARAHTILATADLHRNLLLETPHEIQRRLLG